MTLAQIQQVVTVAEEKSIGKAAAKLYMNQPNLSQSISKLEKELNLQIFQRTSNGVVLTDEGFYCLKLCREILERTEKLQSCAGVSAPAATTDSSIIHFTVATHSYEFFMQSVSRYARLKKPRMLDVDVKEVSGTAGLKLVDDAAVDFALTTIYPYTRERKESQILGRNLNMQSVGTRVSGIYVSIDNSDFSENEYVDFEKLAGLPFFMANSGELTYSEIVSFLEYKGIEFKCASISRASTWGYIVRAVNVQNGFALGTESTDKNPINPLVKFIPFNPEIIGPAEVACITKTGKKQSKELKEFIEILKTELRK